MNKCGKNIIQKNNLSISIENNKYTFVVSKQGNVSCLRYGKPWVMFNEGSKALVELLYKFEEFAIDNKDYKDFMDACDSWDDYFNGEWREEIK